MTCGIYLLGFTGTDKVYVGQSINIEHRYSIHLNKLLKCIHTIKLNDAYKTYGTPTCEILEECEEDRLNILESFHINLWDSINNGFNTAELIGNYNKQYGNSNPSSMYTEDQIELVFSLLTYSNDSISSISRYTGVSNIVINSIQNESAHKWLKDKYPIDYALLSERKLSREQYVAVCDRENIENIFSLLVSNPTISYDEIANKFNTSYSIVANLGGGYSYLWLQTKYPVEYTVMENNRAIRKGHSRKIIKNTKLLGTVIHTTGIIENIYVMTEFSKKYNLDLPSISKLISRKLKSHKGWKLLDIGL